MNVTASDDGRTVEVEAGELLFSLSAQEAYELSQRLDAVLPKLVQPFQPFEP